jgi:hypothetical protein
MHDLVTRGEDDEAAPLAGTSGGPWAHAKKTHDEKQKGCLECDYCQKKYSGRNATRVSSTAFACPWQYQPSEI